MNDAQTFPRQRSPERREQTVAASRGVLILTVLHAVLAATAYLVLASAFGFPDILRQPAEVVLAAFNQNAGIIRTAYYAFTLSSLLFIPIAVLIRRGAQWWAAGLSDIAVMFGAFAGFAQMLGFARWPLYIPYLAQSSAAAQPGSAQADGILLLYEAANRYSGMTVGEHLGWLFQGLWMICLGLAVVRQWPERGRVGALGWVGVALGGLILVSAGEQFQAGLEGPLGLFNTIATTAAPFWLIGLGIWLVRGRAVAAA